MRARQNHRGAAHGRRARGALLGLVLGASVPFAAAHAQEQTAAETPPAMCWTPDALKSRPEEKLVVKGNHTFDRPPAEPAATSAGPLPVGLRGAVRRVTLPPGRKLIALTFDLCEQPGEIAGYDGAIIDYLRANGIKATLFVGGKWMRSHAERAAQLAADPLFELANHSEAHRNLRLLEGQALREEIDAPQRAYEALHRDLVQRQCFATDPARLARLQPRLGLFRFPYGACNPQALAAVNDAGLIAIQWDLSTGDPSPGQSAKAIVETMVHRTKPGSIIIAHANGRGHHTAEAIPVAIPRLQSLGFEFVTVSELLAAGTPEIVSECYDNRPGDTNRYDHFLTASRHVTSNK